VILVANSVPTARRDGGWAAAARNHSNIRTVEFAAWLCRLALRNLFGQWMMRGGAMPFHCVWI
jgi:hypothetical protein